MKEKYILHVLTSLTILTITALFSSSCKKELYFSKGNLTFSKDTVVFDTIFTTIGSTTMQFKIYNNEKQTVKISEVELMGGANSPFRINLDGLSGTLFGDIEIEGKDSLFCFVEVTLSSNNATNPLIVEDSIRFRTNGKDQYVILAAWGQDMYYHYSNLDGSASEWNLNEGIWPNDKPHVIYGAAFVDEGKTLTIPAGTQIHLHKNSFLYVYKGTLNIEGEPENEVVIQGDRLEDDYDDVAGQYYGVYFKEAKPSSIKYAIIKNGTAGIHIEGDGAGGTTPTVSIENTIIINHARYGIMNYAGGKVVATNCLIAKNGYHGFINLAGSGFDFNHCTFAGYAGGQAQLPVVGIADYYTDGQNTLVTNINGSIKNSIIYGNNSNEIAINEDNVGSNTINISHSIIRLQTPSSNTMYANIIWNQDPKFKDVPEWDFTLNEGSPAINSGTPSSVAIDLLNATRDPQPDLGCYEFQ